MSKNATASLYRVKAGYMCQRCGGYGYVVYDAEWEPYAVRCEECRSRLVGCPHPYIDRIHADDDGHCVLCKKDEIERLRAVLKDVLRGVEWSSPNQILKLLIERELARE